MSLKTLTATRSSFERLIATIKYFLALSRTPHSVMDIATPAAAALLYLGAFPPLSVTLLGLVAAFSGYTAVYALNDLVDHGIDREKMAYNDYDEPEQDEGYLDGLLTRHPLARGKLSFKMGLAWVIGWAGISFMTSYLLNPMCAFILLVGALLETLYCATVKTTQLRIFVSGAVKTMGAMAAVFAVDPDPSPAFTLLLFAWIFFWEIGGQKLPADWYDIEEDRRVGAKTVPSWLGKKTTGLFILISLVAAISLNAVLFAASPADMSLWSLCLSAVAWVFLLLRPALHLKASLDQNDVSVLFNRSSLYPLAILIIVGINLIAA